MKLLPFTHRIIGFLALGAAGVSGYAGNGDKLLPPGPLEFADTLTPENPIDRLVLAQLQGKKIQPAHLCCDAVFLRRAYLDLIGTLPTPEESANFLQDSNRNKRAALVDRLLGREEFADFWAMHWSDLLRVKSEFPINLWPNAAQSYHHWIRTCLKENKPLDGFARELLTASGSNFENPPANFYRAMQNKTAAGIAQAVALTFMGTRVENWQPKPRANIEGFFANVGYKSTSEWKEEIVYFNPASTNPGALNGIQKKAFFPDGTPVLLTPDNDPRAVFANWLLGGKNPWFARSVVNRVWSWLLGCGIISTTDEIRNSPSNPQLLTFLQNELVGSGYNLKRLCRLIMNSKTYQLSAIPQSNSPEAAANFASYPLRRMDAEVLIDAIDQIAGTNEKYSSAIPEPHTFIPDNLRSIGLPDGSISSPFLELFGRPSRDTGQESERNNQITASQKLNLINSTQVQRKIEQSPLVAQAASTQPSEAVNRIYLSVLSRYPLPNESKIAVASLQSRPDKHQAVVDLTWALLNSSEFIYLH